MTKTYVDTTLVKKLRELGLDVRNLWEMPGPKGTRIAFMNGYMANGRVFIVQTYKENAGWEVYTSSNQLFFDDVVNETINWLNGESGDCISKEALNNRKG